MKKVLALVLALTMMLGFASTSMAASYRYFDLFKDDFEPEYTVGDLDYTKYMDVDGNEEYKVKFSFDASNLASFVDTTEFYKEISTERSVLEIIDFYGSRATLYGDWEAADLTAGNAMYDAIDDLLADGEPADSAIYTDLITAMGTDTFRVGYKSTEFQSARDELIRAYNNYAENGYYFKPVSVLATSKDATYATITGEPTLQVNSDGKYEGEFTVRFTNTTFDVREVDVELRLLAKGASQYDVYEYKTTLTFDVHQAQYRTFTGEDAKMRFSFGNDIELSSSDFAYISAEAFETMLQNENRTITVLSGNSKIRFDKDSTNLPQDVFVGNFKTSNTGSTAASISGFSSTTAAKIKLAVGESYYNANSGKTLSVYDANGNKLDIEATLQGDYTVNFFAPLSSYTIGGPDYQPSTGSDNNDTPNKDNPSMGGGF